MTTVVASIPSASRQGHFQFDIGQVPPQVTGSVFVNTTVPLSDMQDPTKSVTAGVYVFDPVAGSYRHVFSATWQGSATPNSKGQWVSPGIEVPIDARMYANPVRATIDIPVALTLSATVEIG